MQELDSIINELRSILFVDGKTENYQCYKAASIVSTLLAKLNIKHKVFNISDILGSNGCVSHFITKVELNGMEFIIDPTFKQFTNNRNDVSYYLTQSDDGKNLQEYLLDKGYFIVNSDNLKLYFDAFMMRKNAYNFNDLFANLSSGETYLRDIDRTKEYKVSISNNHDDIKKR